MPDNERVPAIHPVKFWTEYENDPENPGEKIGVDWVSWVKVGTMTGETTSAKIARLMPRENRKGETVVSVEWPSLEKAYNSWKESEEIPVEGTPLAAWPGVTQELAAALKPLHILTLEDFAQAPDHVFKGLPVPNMAALREQAFAFLLAQGGDAETAAEIQKRDDRIVELEGELETAKAGAGDVEQLKTDNEQLKNDLEASQGELAAAKTSLEAVQNELEDAKAALASLAEEPTGEPDTETPTEKPAKPKKAALNDK